MREITPVVRDLIWAMEGRGLMQTQAIYRAFKTVCDEHKHELPLNWIDEVRQTLHAHCQSHPQWNRRDDFFVYHRAGYCFKDGRYGRPKFKISTTPQP
jgi:hypothetical protein